MKLKYIEKFIMEAKMRGAKESSDIIIEGICPYTGHEMLSIQVNNEIKLNIIQNPTKYNAIQKSGKPPEIIQAEHAVIKIMHEERLLVY